VQESTFYEHLFAKIIFDSSRLSIERLLHPLPKKNATDFWIALQKFNIKWQNTAKLQPKGSKTHTIRWQKLTPKGGKLSATAHSIFFSCTPKNLKCTPKKYHLFYKKSICTAKIAISTFSYTLGILLSFWETFSYFPILSQLLAHCADLSKSEGQLCCCHETGLKPSCSKNYKPKL
jgi:hypothetical protein